MVLPVLGIPMGTCASEVKVCGAGVQECPVLGNDVMVAAGGWAWLGLSPGLCRALLEPQVLA